MDNRSFAKIWNDVDYYALAEGNKDVMSAILLLLSNINYDSAIIRYDKHLRARIQIRSRKELAELLHLNYENGRTRERIKKLFDIGLVFESTTKINDNRPFHTYYLNPLIGMRNKGISLDCYVHFRDILKHKLSERAIKNLDRHIVDEYATSPNILVDGACPTGK